MDTVENELVFCLENVLCDPREMDGKIARALDFCGIGHLRGRKLVTLSGGEKQKTMLACVAALGPRWLVLDEPFANIDPDSARDIALRLHELKERDGTGIVAVDHHLDVWTEIADEIIVMGKGGETAMRGVDPKSLPEDALAALGVAIPARHYQERKPAKLPEGRQVVLDVQDLAVEFDGGRVLDGATAQFYRGRIHAVTGGSGSGKSTLFGVLCGLNKYTGAVSAFGEKLNRKTRKKLHDKMGFVFQSPQDQFVSNSVAGEIRAGLAKGDAGAEEKVKEILKSIGLWRYRYISPYMLSQGQQRRLAVAALLAGGCEILVCDEPTYAQDRESIIALMSSLQDMVVQGGLTLVFSTHDHKLAQDYADVIYHIEGGRIYEVGQPGV